ncbi:MAG: hypothetical protein WAN74_04910 [Thermoplasmata archaeon]
MGADHGTPRVSQQRLDGSTAQDSPSTDSRRIGGAPPAPNSPDAPGTTGSRAPGTDDEALEERRRRWAIERARFEAAHPAPRIEPHETDGARSSDPRPTDGLA